MKIKLTLLSIVLANLLLIRTEKASAGTPVVHISATPAWILPCKPYNKKPPTRNIEDGAYDELIEEQVNVETQATYNHIIIQTVSEAGVQNNSEISVSFNPAYERLDFHSIIVWRNNKPQARLQVEAFKMLADEDEFEKFLYNGTYSAKYILSDIRKGDKIEYAYTITGGNPIFNNKFCRSIYLQASRLIAHQYTTLLFSTGRRVNIKPFNLISQPKVSLVGNMERYEWEDFQVPAAASNKYQPDWVNLYARVQVSDYQSWAEVINWGLKVNPIPTAFTGELADSIAQLKKRAGNDKEKYFRSAVTLVQDEVRYMGIETGEYSNKANAPDKVFKQRYGDCKDKSLLLASILNAGGIEAHLVLINTDIKGKLMDFIPSTALFNHMTVAAAVNGKQVFIDATIAYQRGKGTDLYYPPYQEGLILKAGNTGLTAINETKAGGITCEEKFNMLNEHAPVKFKVTTIYSLSHADEVRDEIASTGLAKLEKGYLDYYSKIYNKIESSDSIVVKDNEEKNELTTIENYTIKDFFKRDSVDGKYRADFYADYIANQLPEIPAQIKTPVSVNYPYSVDFTTLAILPSGWNIATKHYAINRSSYDFSFDKTVLLDTLSLRYHFAYLKDYVAANNLSEFKDDIKDLKDDKLSFSFSYIPDIKKVPFEPNKLLFAITLLIIGLSVFAGLKIFKTETEGSEFHDENNPVPIALGGWLILLVLQLIVIPLTTIMKLAEDNSFTVSKWNIVTKDVSSIINRASLVFEVSGEITLVCFSIFCLILIFKKRDIAPHFLKIYLIVSVIFLVADNILKTLITGNFLPHDMGYIIGKVIFAAVWTYYLNVSTRVQQTFVVPYPD